LDRIQKDEPSAPEALLPLVYDELRKLAAGQMANEAPGHTLDATALVHEAYLRLVGPVGDRTFANRQISKPDRCSVSWPLDDFVKLCPVRPASCLNGDPEVDRPNKPSETGRIDTKGRSCPLTARSGARQGKM
jgi:hypothetical protein